MLIEETCLRTGRVRSTDVTRGLAGRGFRGGACALVEWSVVVVRVAGRASDGGPDGVSGIGGVCSRDHCTEIHSYYGLEMS